jgi:hypothetical protein
MKLLLIRSAVMMLATLIGAALGMWAADHIKWNPFSVKPKIPVKTIAHNDPSCFGYQAEVRQGEDRNTGVPYYPSGDIGAIPIGPEAGPCDSADLTFPVKIVACYWDEKFKVWVPEGTVVGYEMAGPPITGSYQVAFGTEDLHTAGLDTAFGNKNLLKNTSKKP